MFSNIERDWKTKYFKHAKTEFTEIISQSESDLKKFQMSRSEQIGDETNLTQRKVQSLEAFDRKLQDSKRLKSKIESDMGALASELKQVFGAIEL